MSDLTIITTCKGRLAHLKQTLPEHSKHAPVVLVDCGCPDGAGTWAEPYAKEIVDLEMQLFHKTLALNVGAAVASNIAPWLMFVDADVTVEMGFWMRKNMLELDEQCFYIAAKDSPLGLQGFLLVHRAIFWGVGGYDIAINTWGAEDYELRSRLYITGVRPMRIPKSCLSVIGHDDEMRVRYLPSKDRLLSNERNFNYLSYKLHHMTGSMALFESEEMQNLLELTKRELDA